MSKLINTDFKEDSFANILQSPEEEVKLNLKEIESSQDRLSPIRETGDFKVPTFSFEINTADSKLPFHVSASSAPV